VVATKVTVDDGGGVVEMGMEVEVEELVVMLED
jgi:hypothetical protein